MIQAIDINDGVDVGTDIIIPTTACIGRLSMGITIGVVQRRVTTIKERRVRA